MKPCENIIKFNEVAHSLADEKGTASHLLFDKIEGELHGMWKHVTQQQALLDKAFKDFKTKVFETEVLKKMQKWTGGVRRHSVMNVDLE